MPKSSAAVRHLHVAYRKEQEEEELPEVGYIRLVKTTYYRDLHAREQVRVNRSIYSQNAVTNVIMHMQEDTYAALLAEVFDEGSGKLYAVIRRYIGSDEIKILFKEGSKE